MKNADAAMYHAKSEGRGVFRFYSPELNAAALENIKLEHELREAVARQELLVYYQPKVDWSGRIVGAEALIRWQHAELGMVSPAKFIPLAEQTGLIVEISDWVLEQACLWLNIATSRVLRRYGFRSTYPRSISNGRIWWTRWPRSCTRPASIRTGSNWS